MSADAVDAKHAIVVEAAGERMSDIEMNVRAFLVQVTDDVSGALDGISAFTGASADMIAESPFALIGPPSKLIEDLLARRERWGFSYVVVGPDEAEAFVREGTDVAPTIERWVYMRYAGQGWEIPVELPGGQGGFLEVLGGEAGLPHLLEVDAHGAELAGTAGLFGPVVADLSPVHTQVRPLEGAHLGVT